MGLLVLALGGCGGGDSRPAANTGTTIATRTDTATQTQTQTQTETQTTPAADPLEGASTDPVTIKATNTGTALLDAVRAAPHEGYDRIVFEFKNDLPGYDVRYVGRPIVEDGSGKTLDVEGSAVLRVRMENALDADLSKPDAPRTYTGPTRFTPGSSQVTELVRTGGFEGVLTWVVGLKAKADFRVMVLKGPPRLVVDVRSH